MTFNPDNPAEHAEYDAWASAANAEIQARPIYGEIEIEACPVTFEKGTGKIKLTPAEVKNYEAWKVRTSVEMRVFPLSVQNARRPIERSLIAEGDYDKASGRTIYTWIKVVRPSLATILGHQPGQADMRALNGKWVKIEMTPDGRKYRDKQNGEERESTTIKFLAIYANEEECRAAYYADSGREAPDENGAEPMPGFEPTVAQPAQPKTQITRETALQFLGALVKDNGADMSRLSGKLQMMPMITEHFPIGSDALQEAIGAILAA